MSFGKRDALFLVVSLVLVMVYVLTAGGGFPLDDSWIHQVFARNLATLGEWSFVPGESAAASTAPLYTVFLAVGYAVSIDYALWTHVLGALALAAAGMLGARLADYAAPESKNLGLFTGLFLVLSWHLIWAAASGMETMLFGTWSLVLVFLAWRELDSDRDGSGRALLLRGGMFGVFAALTTLTRPEGVLLAGLAGLLMLVARPQGSWRGVIVWGVGAAVGFFITMSPYLLLNYQITGGFLPSTAAAKQQQNANIIAQTTLFERIWIMVRPLTAGAHVFLLPGLLYYLVMVRRRGDWLKNSLYWLPVLWGVALILLYALRLPAPFQHGRYVIPALPVFIVCGVVGTAGLMTRWRFSLAGRVLTRVLAISAAVTVLGFALWVAPGIYRQDVRIIEEEMVAAAHWIADNIPQNELLVIHDIGAVGYFAPRPILDIAGLVDPAVIPIVDDGDALWQLMRQRDGRYLMAFPDQIPGDDPHDPRLCEIFNTQGPTSNSVGGPNMAIYRLSWDRSCEF